MTARGCSRAGVAHRGGFTLIELLITVAVVAILASAALQLSEVTHRRAKEQDLRRALITLRDAIDAYKRAVDEGRIAKSADASGYPPTLAVLVEGVEEARSADSRRLYFLRRVPRDPFEPDATIPAPATWALRSYRSPPDRPQSGVDVFDVASKSERVGLNGIAYAEW